MNLLSRTPTCHERGMCQRTTPQCRRVCHLVDPTRGEPPLGYEAARPSTVHQLHAEHNAAQRLATSRDEEADRPAESWAVAARLGAAGLLLLAVLAGVVYSLLTPDSLLHRIGWAVMHVTS